MCIKYIGVLIFKVTGSILTIKQFHTIAAYLSVSMATEDVYTMHGHPSVWKRSLCPFSTLNFKFVGAANGGAFNKMFLGSVTGQIYSLLLF